MSFILLSCVTFLSAFLLFQIELIVGKLLLPQYGGSYLVWGACIVFFQGILLLGYVASHRAITCYGIARYLKIHAGLLILPFFFFPGRPLSLTPENSHALPLVVDIFWRLLISIGPVFFVLSTISLVTQMWLSQSTLKQRANPYTLYAVSNLGSFLALLSYPFWIETWLGLSDQLLLWRMGYGILCIVSCGAFWLIRLEKPLAQDHVPISVPLPWPQNLRWLVLSAASVMMFLSVTNMITYEITPVPLLWIIPLSIYLLSFVLNFKQHPWMPRWLHWPAGFMIGINTAMFFLVMKTFIPTTIMLFLVCGLLFSLCMYTQRELIQSKPEHPSQLTQFYVMISLGGFLGGIVTTWIVPLFSTMLIEFMIALLLIALSLKPRAKMPLFYGAASVAIVVITLLMWPQIFKSYNIVAVLFLFSTLGFAFHWMASYKRILVGFLGVLILFSPWLEAHWKDIHYVAKHRNYYGIYKIYDHKNMRLILHGTTLHGVQLIDPAQHNIPLGYYSPTSAVGGVLLRDYFHAKRLGLVGLGAGTLSLYAQPQMPMDIFEIDPDVLSMAKKYFTYLALAPGPIDHFIGDARVSLQNMPDRSYDILVIDAFSGDAIPVHLINLDVVKLYQKKLSSHGGILFHITNRYVDLKPLLANIARDVGSWVAFKEVPDGGFNLRSSWVLMTWDRENMGNLMTHDGWTLLSSHDYPRMRSWSDDYSSILPLLKTDDLINSITHFKFWSVL